MKPLLLLLLFSCSKEHSCEGCRTFNTCMIVQSKNIMWIDTSGDGVDDEYCYMSVGNSYIPSRDSPTLFVVVLSRARYDTAVRLKPFCWDRKDNYFVQVVW